VGYIFVDGYWDYPLADRGLLFAPVYLRPRLYVNSDFVYVPRYVIYTDFLFGALFSRPDEGCYYFGDYFGDGYARRGFTAWIDIRIGGHGYDPLFGYYRQHYASDRHWERDVHELYVGRHNGEIAPPPRTFAQQTKVVQDIANNATLNVTNVNYVTVAAPLTQVDRRVKLETVSRDQRAELRKNVQVTRDAAVQRQKTEAQLLSQGSPPTKPTDKPVAVKLNLPKAPAPPKGTTALPTSSPVMTPTPEKEAPPSPPTRDVTPPSPPKKDVAPLPPQKKDVTPPPPPAKKDVPPPSPPKKDVAPPPPPKRDVPPPPKKDVAPPPPPKKEPPPPPPPKRDLPPSPPQKVVSAPPPPPLPPKRVVSAPPPPPKKVVSAPPPPPPPPRKVVSAPLPLKKDTSPPKSTEKHAK
jgi:hypothetical protein